MPFHCYRNIHQIGVSRVPTYSGCYTEKAPLFLLLGRAYYSCTSTLICTCPKGANFIPLEKLIATSFNKFCADSRHIVRVCAVKP